MKLRKNALLPLFLIVYASADELKQVWKCCDRNEQLSWNMKSCVTFNESSTSKYTTKRHIVDESDFHWFPQALYEKNIQVLYNGFDATHQVVYSFNVKGEWYPALGDDEGKILPEFITGKRYCCDATENPDRSPVIISTVSMRSFFKCCAKNKRINSDMTDCESIPGQDEADEDEDIIDTRRYPSETEWVPQRLSGAILKVEYFTEMKNIKWNIVSKEDSVDWKITSSVNNIDTLALKEVSASANATEHETDIFCFDKVADGPLYARVLLAATYEVNKCCGRGQQFDRTFANCVAHPGIKKQNKTLVDTLDFDKNPDEDYWIPGSLRHKRLGVKFDSVFQIESEEGKYLMISDERIWILQKEHGIPFVSLNITFLSGEMFLYHTSVFCFDYITDVGKLLIVSGWSPEIIVSKCCFPGEVISTKGFCEKFNGTSWTPGQSVARDEFNATITTSENVSPPLSILCQFRGFRTYPLDNPRALQTFHGKRSDGSFPRMTFFCHDYQRTAGGLEEVVGACTFPSNGDLYSGARALGAVSAALLLGAAGAAVIRQDSRRTAHGRALACHALCLAAANGLQVTWFFTQADGAGCDLFMYPIYFFMIAANFWLTAITVNMACGFRQPLGAMAAAGSGGSVRRRFALMNVFAWGGAVMLSVFAALSHVYREQAEAIGMAVHSFYETRTCQFESIPDLITDKRMDKFLTEYSHLLGDHRGSLCYYYGPMAILVVINAVCIGHTIFTIRSMRKDSAFLQRDSGKHHSRLRSMLLYAKLLLSAGIAELIVEGVTWAVGRRPLVGKDLYSLWIKTTEDASIFVITLSFLDVFRAVSVFWLCWGKLCQCGGENGTFLWIKKRLQAMWGRVVEFFRKDSEDPGMEIVASDMVATHM